MAPAITQRPREEDDQERCDRRYRQGDAGLILSQAQVGEHGREHIVEGRHDGERSTHRQTNAEQGPPRV